MSVESANGAQAAPSFVTSALKNAGDTTGVSFDFLLKMAKRESSLDPRAQAKTSTAAGLFQFIEQTWFAAVKKHGAKHGLAEFAKDITGDAYGDYGVADAARREEILNLRFDAKASAALAGELANDNKRALEAKLGRGVSNAELYAAHFLGATGAATILRAKTSDSAAQLLPKAAAANRPVFYDGDRERSVGEVMASIARSMGEAISHSATAPETKSLAPLMREGGVMLAPVALRLREGVSLDGPQPEAPERRGAAPLLRDGPSGFASTPGDQLTLQHSNLSAAALRVLQALDPTRLTQSREDGRRS